MDCDIHNPQDSVRILVQAPLEHIRFGKAGKDNTELDTVMNWFDSKILSCLTSRSFLVIKATKYKLMIIYGPAVLHNILHRNHCFVNEKSI